MPSPDWLLIPPLLLELYLFILGVALFLSALFVRFRDIGQVWELVLQLIFYASPIIYPVDSSHHSCRRRFPKPVRQVSRRISGRSSSRLHRGSTVGRYGWP